jgi:S-DNA-T family DNA segregation ATPase FtsK/SpoIIIE
MAQIEKAAIKEDAKAAKDEGPADKTNDYDELLPQAVDVILETGQASVSLLQRRLKLGYSRAARLVDQMEEMGVVGPFQGSKPRDILITRQQWQEMQLVQGTAPGEVLQTQLEFDDSEDDDDNVF